VALIDKFAGTHMLEVLPELEKRVQADPNASIDVGAGFGSIVGSMVGDSILLKGGDGPIESSSFFLENRPGVGRVFGARVYFQDGALDIGREFMAEYQKIYAGFVDSTVSDGSFEYDYDPNQSSYDFNRLVLDPVSNDVSNDLPWASFTQMWVERR
jgi:hypothetical protein